MFYNLCIPLSPKPKKKLRFGHYDSMRWAGNSRCAEMRPWVYIAELWYIKASSQTLSTHLKSVFQVQPLCLLFFFSHSQRLPKSITPNLSFIPRNFYYRMSRDEGCLRLQTPLLLSVFSGSPFPAWGSDRSSERDPPPPTPPLLLLLLTPLFSCKWECCFSVVIPNDKEVCNLNTWRQTSTPPPKYLQSAPLTHVRKSGGREVGVGAGGERGQGEMVVGWGGGGI